jgi:hypothetical protein
VGTTSLPSSSSKNIFILIGIIILKIPRINFILSEEILNEGENKSWTWWHMPGILALRSLRQEDHETKASLGYIQQNETKPE